MPTTFIDKCDICKFPCKEEKPSEDCKFIPKDKFLGFPTHFKDDPTKPIKKHEPTSRLCVVCKGYFHYKKISWLEASSGGLYSFCPECADRLTYIVKCVPAIDC